MPTAVIDGCTIHYQIRGEGAPVALTPGGRLGMDAIRSTSDLLATRYRVFQWDRRNTGASDVWIGDPSEQLVWADDLAEMLRRLDMAPAYLAGGSAGSRVAYLTALRHPDVVKGLVLWSVSGGPYSSQFLGYQYHTPFITEAMKGGMEAVIGTPFFRERIDANPSNRGRLLALDPVEFVAVMHRWNRFFYYRDDTPVIGATRAELRSLRCPALVFEGNDDVHPPEAAEAVHRLVEGSEFVPSPWTTEDFVYRQVGRVAGSVVDLYPRLGPAIFDFIDRTEAM
jgi:2-hydroxy-6-oxonona-2,4-dienedioate hydrolase